MFCLVVVRNSTTIAAATKKFFTLPFFLWERLGNQLFESKKDSNTQKKKTQWYHYNLSLVSNYYQDCYQGINIFGEWYHYNLALVPSKSLLHAREIFQRIKWPNYPRLSLLRDSNGWTPRQALFFYAKLNPPLCFHAWHLLYIQW